MSKGPQQLLPLWQSPGASEPGGASRWEERRGSPPRGRGGGPRSGSASNSPAGIELRSLQGWESTPVWHTHCAKAACLQQFCRTCLKSYKEWRLSPVQVVNSPNALAQENFTNSILKNGVGDTGANACSPQHFQLQMHPLNEHN